MDSTTDMNNLSWSSGTASDQMGAISPTLHAYQQACAAYRRLEDIAKRHSRDKLHHDESWH